MGADDGGEVARVAGKLDLANCPIVAAATLVRESVAYGLEDFPAAEFADHSCFRC